MGKKGAFLYLHFIAVLITLSIAIITIIAGFGSHINPNKNELLPFLGLATPILLFANLVCLLYWVIKWRVWGWIALIAIISNYSYINSMYHLSIDIRANNKIDPVTILSYNVHGFRSNSTTYELDDIIRLIDSKKTDIVCFQEFAENEYCKKNEITKKMKNFPYFAINENSQKGFGLAVFSKYPIKKATNIAFFNSKNGAIWTDIMINCKNIRVFNCHLQTTNINQTKHLLYKTHPDGFLAGKKYAIKKIMSTMIENSKKRANQVDQLKQIMDTTRCPIIFCGDFNGTPTSYAYHEISKNLNDGFISAGSGFGNTFRYFHQLLRIDYIFHSKEFKAISYKSPSIDFSDHNPVIMELAF